jgi:hypothetical protein
MAYATTNPPQKVAGGIGGGLSLWLYSSADVHTDVDLVGYFTDGDALGMKVNDLMMVSDTTTPFGATSHTVITVTAGGAATVAAALLI